MIEGGKETITFEGAIGPGGEITDDIDARHVITAEDLKQLDANAQKLIRAYERTMTECFDRWTELKPKRYAQDPETRREARQQSDDVPRALCAELAELLDFIRYSMGKSLADHYYHIRFVCRQDLVGPT